LLSTCPHCQFRGVGQSMKQTISKHEYCHQIYIVIRSILSSYLYCHLIFIVIRSILSSDLYCHQIYIVIRSLLSSDLCCHRIYIVIRSILSSDLYCHQIYIVEKCLLYFFYFMKIKFKQWWSTIPPISPKRTVTFHLTSLNIKTLYDIWSWKSRLWLETSTKKRRGYW
jgi:hypothetical protein